VGNGVAAGGGFGATVAAGCGVAGIVVVTMVVVGAVVLGEVVLGEVVLDDVVLAATASLLVVEPSAPAALPLVEEHPAAANTAVRRSGRTNGCLRMDRLLGRLVWW